jgi:DNA-binding CsgD family transcriptional regulator
VNSHKAALLRKLGCQNALQLVVIAHRAGLKFDDSGHFHGV